MALLNPHALWWLLAIPFLVLLHLLRARRREVLVPSLLLWQRAVRELERHRPSRRFQRDLLLLLQILAVLCAALALARPELLTAAVTGSDLVVVLDGSIRMQSRDVSPTRFEAARRAATELVARAPAGSSVAVVFAARTPRLVAPPGGKAEALRALRDLAPTDGEVDLAGAVRLAQALRRPGRTPEVHLFSATAVPGAVLHRFAARTENVAIADLLAFPQPSGDLRVLVRVRNESGSTVRSPLRLSVDGREALRLNLRLDRLEERTLTASLPGGEVVEATLDVQDDLAADNRRATLGGEQLPAVLLVGRSSPYLESALSALRVPRVGRSLRVDPATWSAYDVAIVDGVPLAELPPGNALLIASVPENLPVAVVGTVRSPVPVGWRRTHPVLRFVDLDGLRIPEALAVEPRGGEVLAEGKWPLVWAYESRTHRVLLVTFDPARSDFPLRPSFPVFLYNALRWLAGERSRVLQAGERLVLPAGAGPAVWITGPSGTFRIGASGGVVRTPPLDRAGVYRVRWPNGSERTYVVQPAVGTPDAPKPAPPPPPPPFRAVGGREVFRAFLAALVGLLFGEWVLYARRQADKTGPVRTGRVS